MTLPTHGRRILEVNSRLIGVGESRSTTAQPRKLSDYRHVPKVYRDVAAKLSRPIMMGPPICDELMALVQHVFTEEEAGAVRHLGMVFGRTAAQVARAENRPVDQVEAALLDRVANDKRAIVSNHEGKKKCYRLLPIMPGMFEMILIRYTPETLTDWHRRFIEIFEALFETGFALDYAGVSAPTVRYLPVGRAIESHPMALPTDQLAAVLDQFGVFAVGQCQCRTTVRSLGRGCDGPLGNCMVMGKWAQSGIDGGWLRQVSKEEALDLKCEAEACGMVNWMMNVASTKGQCSCSCCGCCCHAMRMVSEFSAPGLFAPPHFLPRVDFGLCNHCGRCARKCPMGALRVDPQAKTYEHLNERCIGCGLCALACEQKHAIAMDAVPDYKLPYKSWFALLSRAAPSFFGKAWNVSRERGKAR